MWADRISLPDMIGRENCAAGSHVAPGVTSVAALMLAFHGRVTETDADWMSGFVPSALQRIDAGLVRRLAK